MTVREQTCVKTQHSNILVRRAGCNRRYRTRCILVDGKNSALLVIPVRFSFALSPSIQHHTHNELARNSNTISSMLFAFANMWKKALAISLYENSQKSCLFSKGVFFIHKKVRAIDQVNKGKTCFFYPWILLGIQITKISGIQNLIPTHKEIINPYNLFFFLFFVVVC